jgi:hypothetical protein
MVLRRHGEHLADHLLGALGMRPDDPRHKAHIDAGRFWVLEHAQAAQPQGSGRDIVGGGLAAIAVDPGQDFGR